MQTFKKSADVQKDPVADSEDVYYRFGGAVIASMLHSRYEKLKQHSGDDKQLSQAKLLAKSMGCKAFYSLMRLPQHDHVNQTVPDAIHTIKDCIEKIMYLVTGNIMHTFKAVNRYAYL